MTDQPPQDYIPPSPTYAAPSSAPPSFAPTGYPRPDLPPGYPQPGPPPGYGYQVYPPQPPFNTYAILALILALVVLPPLGIFFGKKAQQEIARTGERGIEMANAAVIIGWVLSIIMGVFLVIWCAFAVFFVGGFFSFFGAAAATAP